MGAYYSAMGVGSIIGALCGGYIASQSYPLSFVFAAGSVLIGIFMTMRLPQRLEYASEEAT